MARKPEESDDRSRLLLALKFASVAIEKESANPWVTIQDRLLVATNGTYSVGTPVDVGLELCPHADMFEAALKQCGAQFKLTQIDGDSFSISSGKFRAVVQSFADAQTSKPDKMIGSLPAKLTELFDILSKVPTPKANDRPHNHSVLLRSGTMAATNGGLLLEAFHGYNLPGEFVLPIETCKALAKITKPELTGFGYSDVSFTFWFADGSFLKTRLLEAQYPKYERLFVPMTNAKPVWKDFFTGLAAVNKFVAADMLFFHEGLLGTQSSPHVGATYQITGLPEGHKFAASFWRQIEGLIDMVQMDEIGKPIMLLGSKVRGIMIGRV